MCISYTLEVINYIFMSLSGYIVIVLNSFLNLKKVLIENELKQQEEIKDMQYCR